MGADFPLLLCLVMGQWVYKEHAYGYFRDYTLFSYFSPSWVDSFQVCPRSFSWFLILSVFSLPRSLCTVADVQVCFPFLESRCEVSLGGCTPPCSLSHHSGMFQEGVCLLIPSPPGHTLQATSWLDQLTGYQLVHLSTLCSYLLPSSAFPSVVSLLPWAPPPWSAWLSHGSLFFLWVTGLS